MIVKFDTNKKTNLIYRSISLKDWSYLLTDHFIPEVKSWRISADADDKRSRPR